MLDTLLAIVAHIIKNRKRIVFIVSVFIVFSVVLCFIIPPRYRATAILMPPVSGGTNLMSLMTRGTLMSDPEVGGTGYMPGSVTPSDVFAFILQSSTIKNIVITECGLLEHYKQTKLFGKKPDKAMYNVAKMLDKATKVKVTDERFITISVEDKNKYKAAEIANKYTDALNRVYATMNMTQGSKMREFIEKRVVQEEATLKKLEDSLKTFQERYRTVAITEEMKAIIEMSAELEAKIIGQQIELDAMKSYSEKENPQIIVLQKKIETAKEEMQNLMRGTKGQTLFIPFMKAPSIAMRFGQLTRDVKIHQEVYALLIQQLEQAKILEAKDTPKVQVLDIATPPYRKSWPRFSIFMIFGFLMGIFISTIYILIQIWWNNTISNTEGKYYMDQLYNVLKS